MRRYSAGSGPKRRAARSRITRCASAAISGVAVQVNWILDPHLDRPIAAAPKVEPVRPRALTPIADTEPRVPHVHAVERDDPSRVGRPPPRPGAPPHLHREQAQAVRREHRARREIGMVQVIGFDPRFDERAHQRLQRLAHRAELRCTAIVSRRARSHGGEDARLGEIVGAPAGHLLEAANSVGGHLAAARPTTGGRNARTLFTELRARDLVACS